MENQKKKYIFVFDTETIIDIESSKKLLELPKNVSIQDTVEKMKNHSKNGFVKTPFHQIVAISFLIAKIIYKDTGEEYEIIDIRSGGNTTSKENELVKGFFAFLKKKKSRLITFNGRCFDIPVLKYRAMKHNIEAVWLYESGDRWNNYNQKYNSFDWHCDLMDIFTNYGASPKISMNDLACVFDIPCKINNQGSDVEDMFYNKKISDIRIYCEQDVLCTYLLYLRYCGHVGKVSTQGYKNCLKNLNDFIRKNRDKEHLKCFIQE